MFRIISRSKVYIFVFQMLLLPLFKLIAALTVKRENIALIHPQLSQSSRYVVVANHMGMLDPFVIGYSLPFSIHRVFGPYRFFIVNRMFKKWWLLFWLFSFGGFPAKWHPKYKYGLAYATELIHDHQTVMIFPEGRIGKKDREYQPRKGIEVLANLPGVKLVPARVKWNRNKGLIKSYSLAIGKPFDGKNMTAEQIMDVVYGLKFR